MWYLSNLILFSASNSLGRCPRCCSFVQFQIGFCNGASCIPEKYTYIYMCVCLYNMYVFLCILYMCLHMYGNIVYWYYSISSDEENFMLYLLSSRLSFVQIVLAASLWLLCGYFVFRYAAFDWSYNGNPSESRGWNWS